MYFSCEDCREERGFSRGHFTEVERWAEGHKGHDVHVNLLGRPGVSVSELIAIERKKTRDEERFQKFIKVITFGLRGETIADRQRKRAERQRNYERLRDSQESRITRKKDET